jgi:hypothetical protein
MSKQSFSQVVHYHYERAIQILLDLGLAVIPNKKSDRSCTAEDLRLQVRPCHGPFFVKALVDTRLWKFSSMFQQLVMLS